jgi:peptidoglycan/LPS O-acetylase OafA/YrhL
MKSRSPSLDALRGIAILLVIGYHLSCPGIFLDGFVGVELFFVLSGFLISGLLFADYQKYGTIRLGRFWVRRAFKILPPVYAFLLILLFVLRDRQAFPLRGFLASAGFCFNYFPIDGPLGHTWSLSVEEHFYLLIPLLLALLVKLVPHQPFHSLPWIFAGLVVLTFVLRLFNSNDHLTHLRVDALFTGVFLRYLYIFKSGWFRRISSNVVLVPGLLFWLPEMVLLHNPRPMTRSFSYTCTEIASACLIAWSFAHDDSRLFQLPPLRLLARIGFYSYSIYLWQQPIVSFFMAWGTSSGGWWVPKVLGFPACILPGIAMAKLVEVPMLKLRDRLTRPTLSPTAPETKALISAA